jgi:hypothetical protein
MRSFLEEVVTEASRKYGSLEDLIFVLPSKRAGTFMRQAISRSADKTIFAPTIFSIEEFVSHVAALAYAANTEQLFALYQTYSEYTKGEKESFHSFSLWGQTLLQDFNEIDRYLIDPKKLFSNLGAVQEINIWSPEAKKTRMMENYLLFWNNLETLYHHFNNTLLATGAGTQGLVYRQANTKLQYYIDANKAQTHVFIGFNALNNAEKQLIQTLLAETPSTIYWDIDPYFLEDPTHDAGFFIRQHQKTWPSLKNRPLNGLGNHYLKEKHIEVIGVPGNISQAKYVGKLLKQLQRAAGEPLKTTAVVLGDESLLNPLLNSIPETVTDVNITMGLPLSKTPLASLFNQFFRLYINKEAQGWFYQPLLGFLSHPYLNVLWADKPLNQAKLLAEEIRKNNHTFIGARSMKTITKNDAAIALLFVDDPKGPRDLIERCLALILRLKEKTSRKTDALSLEYLYRFHRLFNQLLNLISAHPFIDDVKSLASLYNELLSTETLDFKGEPLQGLQIMGMLESRNLDFETIILTSVNEGILPSGKSNNSFIPFDLKKYFGLPTYKEKDAIYTYHFYRLLQRAKNIYLLYNTEPDILEGGEMSRLIRQLLSDENKKKDITERIAAPLLSPAIYQRQVIEKDVGLMELIKNHAMEGFSPSSLSNYIMDPISFYKRNLLKIEDVTEVEETVAANTFGTIVHDSLEALYTPFIGSTLSKEGLMKAKSKVKQVVALNFAKSMMGGDMEKGKNLLAFNVLVRYVENFIDVEIGQVERHDITILGLEQKLKISLDIPGIPFSVALKGKLDRIDRKDGTLRIIDYKTGKVETKNIEIVDWPSTVEDDAHTKGFQLLCYAVMYLANAKVDGIEAGIISFKELQSGLLKFAKKDRSGQGAKKVSMITEATLKAFMPQLARLIAEICDPTIPFKEKER